MKTTETHTLEVNDLTIKIVNEIIKKKPDTSQVHEVFMAQSGMLKDSLKVIHHITINNLDNVIKFDLNGDEYQEFIRILQTAVKDRNLF